MAWKLVDKSQLTYMAMIQAGLIFKSFPDLINITTLLWHGGFRICELYQTNRWTKIDDNNYSVQVEKGGNPRLWPVVNTPNELKECILNNKLAFQYCRYPTITRLIEKSKGVYIFKTGEKGICTHIFRYAKITEMHLAGSTDQEICEFIGEVSEENIRGYYNASIYYQQINN